MARIERIKRRLDNWAIWKARGDGGGLGYHTCNILAVDVWERGSYNGVMIPVFEQEAEETDKAVRALAESSPHIERTLQLIYIRDLGVNETARQLGKGPSTIKAHLEQADHAIDQWLQARATERDKARAAAEAAAQAIRNSFTT